MKDRFNLAMRHGFYLEALLIDYAILEDRLISFLWYAGIMSKTDNFSFGTKANRALLKRIYSDYTGKGNDIPRLRNFGDKIKVLRAPIKFARSSNDGQFKYEKTLHSALNSIDLDELERTLIKIDDWRQYRNEVIHAAMTKNIHSLTENLQENAELGMRCANIIDNAAGKLMRRPAIRQSVRLFNKK